MTNVKSVNFYDLCRICTATTEQKIDIFSPEGKIKNLCAKISECMPLNVDEKDRLPKVLCPQCIQNLDSYIEFRNICRNSQAMLTSCLNTASAQNGGKVLIKDILSSTGKSLSVLNNCSSSVGNHATNNAENLQSQTTHSLNQLQQQPPQHQQLFSIQAGNVVTQPVVNPLTISASGTLPNQDFLNSIMQAVGIQGDNIKIEKAQTIPQYTITVDNTTAQQPTASQISSQPNTPTKDKETKNNALEEFLKMKPNIKVTPVNKKQQYHNQQQDQQHLHQQQHEVQQQLQQDQQQQQQQQQQNQLVQFQLQQLIQQQIQQQQLQQQLQILTSQLQPQQITITAPSLPHQTMLPPATLTADNSLCDNNNDLSPSKNKKPKLNFVLTPPNQITNQTLSATLPQHTTATAAQNATPQIQLQFQPTLTPQTLQLQHTQQQHNQHAATAALLSNLAPLLQPQTQLNAALQTQALNSVTQNNGTNMLSPNKCFLPITIKDENTDQQFVAHIDAKNFLLPTTYQLQMKLQPQIATADGQPIMQLAPTSIPATLQLAPQAMNPNPTFQAAAAVAAFNSNSTLPTQLMHPQQQNQQLQTQAQQQVLQQITNLQGSQQQPQVPTTLQSQSTPQSSQIQTQAAQISLLPQNVQITSQQVLTTPNKKIPTSTTTKKAAEAPTSIEAEKKVTKVTKPTQPQSSEPGNETKTLIKQKYKISQQPGSNTIEITPTTSFTQQIMKQVQQQQQQKQKLIQQQNTEPSTTTTVTTQHGGITVQRITTKLNSPATTTGNGTNENVSPSTRQAIINPVQHVSKSEVTATIPKIPMLNKQNITISRIAPQNQQQQAKPQPLQPQAAAAVSSTALKIIQHPIKSQRTETTGQQKKQQTLHTRIQHQQQPQQQQQQQKVSPLPQPQILSNIPNTSLRISPAKKFIKKTPRKSIETTEAHQQSQPGYYPTAEKVTTSTTALPTQVHYITDVTTILPASSNENAALATETKIAAISTPPTTTITSTDSSTPPNSDQPRKNLECGQCGRVFKKKEHLTQHVKLHSGVRPFKCNEEGCTKAFHRKEHLLRHLVSHSGKKMFSCDICQKPFSRKDNLSKHRKIHTDPNVNNYVCEFCNKSFAVKSYYEQHKILHQTKATAGEDKKTVNEVAAKTINQSSNKNTTNQIEYQTQAQQQQKQVTQTPQITQQTAQQQQLHLVQQQLQQLQQHNQTQSQQIMHLQLPTSIVTTQDMAGNTITITQASDPQANNLKTITLSGTTAINAVSGGNHHDATVLNLPTSLANFVQLSQAQFVNATTGQIMGLKIEK